MELYTDKRKLEPCFWLWDPSKINNRIVKQDSVFVFSLAAFPALVHDGRSPEEDSGRRIDFISLRIGCDFKNEILKDLDSLFVINAETVFYDLTGYSQSNGYSVRFTEHVLPDRDCLFNLMRI
jgi:hypothetical protein